MISGFGFTEVYAVLSYQNGKPFTDPEELIEARDRAFAKLRELAMAPADLSVGAC